MRRLAALPLLFGAVLAYLGLYLWCAVLDGARRVVEPLVKEV